MKKSAFGKGHSPHYVDQSVLGQRTEYPQHYSPDVLHAIPRSAYRATVEGSGNIANIYGVDEWTCYELSWLDKCGKPQVRIGQLKIPVDSPNIIESKSLKLYLNSLNQRVFRSADEFVDTVECDLAKAVAAEVSLSLQGVVQGSWPVSQKTLEQGVCIDDLAVSCEHYQRDDQLLQLQSGTVSSETLYSHLLRSNCPATQQPDWATLVLTYSGPKLDREQLLKYLVSYRNHSGFHEQCVEQIYADLCRLAEFEHLTVAACYTRRGGIDINPCRSTRPDYALPPRFSRQ